MILAMLMASTASAAPICTDRPTKANSVCTVPSGHFQIESSGVAWSRAKVGGVETKSLTVGSSFAKYGLGDRSDLQLGFTPYVRIDSEGSSISGFGDVTARYKYRLTGDEAPVKVAIVPFVKLPTAKRGIGNRKVEGGVAIPISFALTGSVAVTLGPEIDLLTDSDGSGKHPAIVNLINLSTPVATHLTLIGELWTNLNFDPSGTIRQASADAALSYSLSSTTQLDLGANLGLTRQTPNVEIYLGISLRK